MIAIVSDFRFPGLEGSVAGLGNRNRELLASLELGSWETRSAGRKLH